jgi:hypothetical protein
MNASGKMFVALARMMRAQTLERTRKDRDACSSRLTREQAACRRCPRQPRGAAKTQRKTLEILPISCEEFCGHSIDSDKTVRPGNEPHNVVRLRRGAGAGIRPGPGNATDKFVGAQCKIVKPV